MRLSPLAGLLLPFLPHVSSWLVPRGLDDGHYTIAFPDGNFSSPDHRIVKRGQDPWRSTGPWPKDPPWPGEISPPRRDDSHGKPEDSLQISHYQCDFASNEHVPWFEYESAFNSLGDYCDRFLVFARTIHISVSRGGTAVAFVCNSHETLPAPCSRLEFRWVERNYLDPYCGHLRPGQAYAPMVGKWYGRAHAGGELCTGEGRTSHFEQRWKWSLPPKDKLACKHNCDVPDGKGGIVGESMAGARGR
ncbi:hypothetical protein DCS_08114 [Drechmeria coniospora]|uniref:Uncharacterized protein n=1 Tax=Drechmeria coniospora TaxID=98403 RepID=A0A151GGB0_DRECN|nr:hypothetical protein DCS_08114 [Drechmeria coniospora]KYK56147.1 hypothetical protein DCS_08114 [Drechmeria coniospora]ODA77725.1 hypothetical protein RJ55_06327 [Drechmeria coniospora]